MVLESSVQSALWIPKSRVSVTEQTTRNLA